MWKEQMRNSHPEVLLTIYKGILKNSSKFTGKHLCESLFLNVAFEILFFYSIKDPFLFAKVEGPSQFFLSHISLKAVPL